MFRTVERGKWAIVTVFTAVSTLVFQVGLRRDPGPQARYGELRFNRLRHQKVSRVSSAERSARLRGAQTGSSLV